MFFGNKNLEDKVTLLLNEIEDLKNQLLVKEQEKEEIKNDFSKQLEKTAANNEKKVELFKQIASHSQEEGLVVFDDKNQLFFSNNLARANIKDFNVVLNAILEIAPTNIIGRIHNAIVAINDKFCIFNSKYLFWFIKNQENNPEIPMAQDIVKYIFP